MRHRFVAAKAERLDRAIAAQTPLSRNRARNLVEAGGVLIDGVRARFSSQMVPAGSVVELRSAPPAENAPPLPERYRDADVLVVDKPSGLPSQAGQEGGSMHVYGILGGKERYVGLHHRLDTPASGLLLVTLRKGANAAISTAMQEGRIHREYIAVVLGDPGAQGAWTQPIEEQPARTEWRRLATGGGASVLACTLRTGRTHQIRRHASEAGHPILGDRRYGGAAGRAWTRLALHAWRLGFPLPSGGAPLTVEAPIPDDLRELVASCGYRAESGSDADASGTDGADPAG